MIARRSTSGWLSARPFDRRCFPRRVAAQDRAVNSPARACPVYLAGLSTPGRPPVGSKAEANEESVPVSTAPTRRTATGRALARRANRDAA
jgi:hypothetical protein